MKFYEENVMKEAKPLRETESVQYNSFNSASNLLVMCVMGLQTSLRQCIKDDKKMTFREALKCNLRYPKDNRKLRQSYMKKKYKQSIPFALAYKVLMDIIENQREFHVTKDVLDTVKWKLEDGVAKTDPDLKDILKDTEHTHDNFTVTDDFMYL